MCLENIARTTHAINVPSPYRNERTFTAKPTQDHLSSRNGEEPTVLQKWLQDHHLFVQLQICKATFCQLVTNFSGAGNQELCQSLQVWLALIPLPSKQWWRSKLQDRSYDTTSSTRRVVKSGPCSKSALIPPDTATTATPFSRVCCGMRHCLEASEGHGEPERTPGDYT